MNASKYKQFILTLGKFATSSIIATLVDISIFMFVLQKIMGVFEAELIAGFVGMIINFILQKKYVFKLNRNLYSAFFLSIAFSLVALFLGGLMMQGLSTIPLFYTYIIIPKLMVIGFKFFFNFFTKKWIFEKRAIANVPEKG